VLHGEEPGDREQGHDDGKAACHVRA
jgi:hypothetical protein